MAPARFRIGTRGSPLALIQAEQVRDRLLAAHDCQQSDAEVIVIKTSGDRIQDRPLNEFGGKGLFTKEIETALAADEINMAVHSMKDVPTVLPDGLEIPCILPREDPRDAFISLKHATLADMPTGARMGTASLRRQAQLKRMRPDIEVVMFRGNVQTRMRKLGEELADATFLAVSGLNRLGNEAMITEALPTDTMLPAVAQGAVGVEIRSNDIASRDALAPLHHRETDICIKAERAFLARLDGSCRTPIAAFATLENDILSLRGEILLPDGTEVHHIHESGDPSDALALGTSAGAKVLQDAGVDFLNRVAAQS